MTLYTTGLVDRCEIHLVVPRDAHIALIPGGRQRFMLLHAPTPCVTGDASVP